MKKDDKIDLGSVQVHRKVFAEIISSAISEVSGVELIQKNISNRLFEVFGQTDSHGIKIKVDENREVTLKLQVCVQYGMNIPDAARQIQETVRTAVDKTLAITLKDINVDVQGISRGKE